MQLPSLPEPKIIEAIEIAIQNERLNRYMAAAENDKGQAFKYYLWNCALCEAFYVPLHFCEIVCRNALSKGIRSKLGNDWYINETLTKIMDERYSSELKDAIRLESKQHGSTLTAHHVVSALSFGFWQHLTTKRFERLLWNEGARKHFPNAPTIKNREDLYLMIESVRRWRNRIAHHRAIFDKKPMLRHQEAIELIKWRCIDTASYVSSVSRVPLIISLRPKDPDLFEDSDAV
jgi:hypothetical protein